MTIRLPCLDPDPNAPFPAPASALRDPDGLLAWGGDLSPTRLLRAYREGIFPWYSAGEPILWWSPAKRAVLDTGTLQAPRRLRRRLRHCAWTLRADTDLEGVVRACATVPRPGQRGTWITPEMQHAYLRLHQLGVAHSVEVFDGERLVGGIYGVHSGAVFCGESMFSRESGASTVALVALCRRLHAWGVEILDAQVPNPHLERLGARTLARAQFLACLGGAAPAGVPRGPWTAAFAPTRAAELA